MPPSPLAEGDGETPLPLDAEALRRWPMPEASQLDKFRRGTVLIVGGHRSTPGAVLLAGVAALRMGAGRLQIATDEDIAAHVAVAAPEAMVVGLPCRHGELELTDEIAGRLGDADSLVVGPGLVGDTPPTRLLGELSELSRPDTLFVIDALAIGAFADLDERHREMLASRVVMTPNRQEVLRIGGCPEDADLPASLARRGARLRRGDHVVRVGPGAGRPLLAHDRTVVRTGHVRLRRRAGRARRRRRSPLPRPAPSGVLGDVRPHGVGAARQPRSRDRRLPRPRAAGPRAAVPADLSQFPITQGAQRGREPLERRRAAAR